MAPVGAGLKPALPPTMPTHATRIQYHRNTLIPLLTTTQSSHIIERMSHTDAEPTTQERKPPTIADIVREKTDDGRLIIDFFTDVMLGRIEGAELCHRIDAAKQLVKYGSKAAAEFLAKYKGVPCGHSINGRPNPADPCTAEDRSLVAVTLNAPATLTRDFLAVLSGIDEFLMARLIRAQTADGVTIIEFLDDVMQDRTDGFKTHHRIAAAKELIVHIVRDEQPAHTPSPSTGEGWGEGDSLNSERRHGEAGLIPPLPQGEGWGEGDPPVVPAQAEGNPDNSTVIPAKSLPRTRYGAGIQRSGGPGATRPSKAGVHPDPNSSVVPAQAGTHGSGGVRSAAANPAHPEPSQIVVPAEAGTQGGGGVRSTAANPAHPEPSSTVIPAKSLPRTRYGAGIQGDGGGRSAAANPARPEPVLNTAEEPAPVELTPAERRIKERLKQHWHEPDPYGAPIDSTHPGRSPPW